MGVFFRAAATAFVVCGLYESFAVFEAFLLFEAVITPSSPRGNMW